MSIASDEAENKYPEDEDWYPGERAADGERTRQYLIEAYEDGRTAPITDDEVEAAAKLLFNTKAWNRYGGKLLPWDKQSVYVKNNYRMNAKSVLNIARRKVAE